MTIFPFPELLYPPHLPTHLTLYFITLQSNNIYEKTIFLFWFRTHIHTQGFDYVSQLFLDIEIAWLWLIYPGEISLEKIHFPFASRYPLQIASWVWIGHYVLFSVVDPHLAWTCRGLLHGIIVSLFMCALILWWHRKIKWIGEWESSVKEGIWGETTSTKGLKARLKAFVNLLL